ncbi:unnamed protein product [Anisakis simplex]|uniref:Uncharacterized protein n=1 Tax=Anisakis simplex TaxID=6269 RepID=A0A3P6RE62_ANISI|nr:unnamed protein product [Anisakis simplex]
MMRDYIDKSDSIQQLFFDFEAYPLADTDKIGIIDMLTQIFLRANIDLDGMAAELIEQSPFGCVFKPADDTADEDNEDMLFGVVSMLEMTTSKKYGSDIWNLLRDRAKKFGQEKNILSYLESLNINLNNNNNNNTRVGLFINERMLHFPPSICSPAFRSLREDILSNGNKYRFDIIVMIQKIRIADNQSGATSKQHNKKKTSKNDYTNNKSQHIIYDNPEEKLLLERFEESDADNLIRYFDYPVQSDVEKESKFNSIVINDVNYRPYRRVCFLNAQQFDHFIECVINN